MYIKGGKKNLVQPGKAIPQAPSLTGASRNSHNLSSVLHEKHISFSFHK